MKTIGLIGAMSWESSLEYYRIIYEELVHGIIRPESRPQYAQVISDLATAGAQGIILGCTEIELLVRQKDSPVPLFPTTRIHAEAAVDYALA
jgi:aspartate racemase